MSFVTQRRYHRDSVKFKNIVKNTKWYPYCHVMVAVVREELLSSDCTHTNN